MARLRRSLSLAVWIWLVCQATTLAAAPFAVPHDAVVEDEVCCAGLAPGQMCPMHHHAHRTPPRPGDALLKCVCPPPDAALASLILGTGFLPPILSLADVTTAVPVVIFSATEIYRSDIPATPPPKR